MNSIKSKVLGLFASLLLMISLYPWNMALAQGGRYEDWHTGPGMMGNWNMGWFGGIFMVVFWILIVVGLVSVIKWLVQATGNRRRGDQSGSRAMDILKERYARGEIDKVQFEDMKRDLANASLR
jgi:putative membrane protein